MSVTFDDIYKNRVASSILIQVNQAIKSGDLPDNELCEVCTYVTVAFKDMKSFDDLIDFLNKMADRWPFFEAVLKEIDNHNNVVGQIEDKILNRTSSVPAAA